MSDPRIKNMADIKRRRSVPPNNAMTDTGTKAFSRGGTILQGKYVCEVCKRFQAKNAGGLKNHVRACERKLANAEGSKTSGEQKCSSSSEQKEQNTSSPDDKGAGQTTGPAPGEENTTQPSPKLRDNHPCSYCNTGYATRTGLSQHMAKKHKEEWNEFKKVRYQENAPTQHKWVDGDFEMLCLGEDEYPSLPKEARIGVNMYIRAKFFPLLTLEAIKSQRRNTAFRDYKNDRQIATPNEQVAEADCNPPNNSEETCEIPVYEQLDQDDLDTINDKPYGEIIIEIQDHLLQAEFPMAAEKAEQVFDCLAKQFTRLDSKGCQSSGTPKRDGKSTKPVSKKTQRRRKKQAFRSVPPSKAKRRELYGMVQKKWRTAKRKSVIDQILTDSLGKKHEPIHTTEELDAYWRTLFNRESPHDQRLVDDSRPTLPLLARTFTKGEVAEALKKANDASTGPDGVPLKHLKDIGPTVLSILYNAVFADAKIPASWKEARTVLIPKTAVPASPAEYRPITISSYYYRIYTSMIGRRMMESVLLSNRQRGFIKEDGIRDNLVLLETLLEDSKRNTLPLHLTFMDVKKAFDSVSHHSIHRALEWAGVPEALRSVISDLYSGCSTTVGGDSISMTRGVKQGDPLSSMLFNLVLEMALSKVPENLGVEYCGFRLCYMAFADDLVIVARSRNALQMLVNYVSEELGRVGLELHPGKCKSLSIAADFKRKTTFVDTSQKILICGHEIPSMAVEDWYKYLGIRIGCKGRPTGEYLDDLHLLLERTTKAPLKPNQRLYTLRTHILPKFQHRMLFEKVTCKTLSRLDMEVRIYVRRWLKLPGDTPLPAFYSDVSSGGLSLLCLRDRVPLLKRQRMMRMRTSNDPLVQLLADQEPTKSRMTRWKMRCKYQGKPYGSKEELAKLKREALWKTCDGKGLYTEVNPRDSRSCFTQLDGPITSLSGAQHIGALSVRLNTIQTPLRKNRGKLNPAITNICDKCPGQKMASLGHISQTCPATHGLRVKRHDRIVAKLAKHFKDDKSVTEVLVEPQLKPNGWALRKPDLVICRNDVVEIIDVQILADQGCRREEDRDDLRKKDKYDIAAYRQAAIEALGVSPQSCTCNVSAFTLTWRGQPAPHSIRLARRLGFKSKLKFLIADALVDTWGMFVTWSKTS